MSIQPSVLFMKTVYIILFFVDTLVLIGLSFLFLRLIDHGIGLHKLVFGFVVTGILASIGLLVFFLDRYTKAG